MKPIVPLIRPAQTVRQSRSKVLRILVVGSLKSPRNAQHEKQFKLACRAIGKILVDRNSIIVLGSEDSACADLSVAAGANNADNASNGKRGRLMLVQPTRTDPKDIGEYSAFTQLDIDDVRLVAGDWTEAVIRQNQMQQADVVILVGGGTGTELVARIGVDMDIPIIPLGAFGGSALRTFDSCVGTLGPLGITREDCEELRSVFSASKIASLLNRICGHESDNTLHPASLTSIAEPEIADRKRFAIGLSFPGEHRPFILAVADALPKFIEKERVFYDEWYESELVGPDGDLKLIEMYRHAEMIVPFFSRYYEKPWCGLEWGTIRGILLERRKHRSVVPVHLDDTKIPGWNSVDFGIRLRDRTPQQIAEVILDTHNKRPAGALKNSLQ